MTKPSLHIHLLIDGQPIPFELLELADPSRSQINSYLKSGICYVATSNSVTIGVLVLNEMDSLTLEIKNIAVKESSQGNGYGKSLLRYATSLARKKGYKFLRIGTGNSSIAQLALYQKEGFEITGIEKDFFINNYEKPIYENGIHCKHMILLEKSLSNK